LITYRKPIDYICGEVLTFQKGKHQNDKSSEAVLSLYISCFFLYPGQEIQSGAIDMDTPIIIAAGIIVIAFIAIMRWRVGAKYGRFRPSSAVTKAYESFSVDPNRNYYISGPDTYPNAIIGIDKTWTLESDLWMQKDLSSQGMKELVQNMKMKALEQYLTLHGFDIFDNRGKNIGNWFSIMGIIMIIKVTGERRVVVHTPPIDIYR
jgi:hypothetical protein